MSQAEGGQGNCVRRPIGAGEVLALAMAAMFARCVESRQLGKR